MKENYWAVVMDSPGHSTDKSIGYTWTKPHPEEKDQKSKKVYAIYPNKEDAIADKKFRGGCNVIKILL